MDLTQITRSQREAPSHSPSHFRSALRWGEATFDARLSSQFRQVAVALCSQWP
jgi:hypothetical protein